MELKPIDMESWPRREHNLHYMEKVVCSYAMTVKLDITSLAGQKLYPAMLWLLTSTVNEMEEFRTILTEDGPAVFDSMHPSYTVFHKQSKTFSVLWSQFDSNFDVFTKNYRYDVEKNADSTAFCPQGKLPLNVFDVSMVPWVDFSAMTLEISSGEGKHLLPIFTIGKACCEEGKTTIPLAIQVHHAVCDGYHVGQFVQRLQQKINDFHSDVVTVL